MDSLYFATNISET